VGSGGSGGGGPADGARRSLTSAARVLEQGSPGNRILTVTLALGLAALILVGLPEMWRAFPAGIDLNIPLYAASRWSTHTQPYPPAAMAVGSHELPYLYPPFLLPFLAPIAGLPRGLVDNVWLLLGDACAVWTCRRIGLPWIAVPFALAWPPYAEGLLTGNVQIWSFAAFAALFCESRGGVLRRRALDPGRDLLNGVLAASVGALKVAQSLPLLFLMRERRAAVVAGVVALATVTIVTLPLVGPAAYADWIAQLRRAADPTWSWTIGGVAPGKFLHTPDVLFTAIAVAITLSVRGRDTVAWLGIALVLVSPSVHGYTFLFLLPALLTIRRDAALLIAFLFLGNYLAVNWWTGAAATAGLMVAMNRWTWLRVAEPEPRSGEAWPAGPGRLRLVIRRGLTTALR
jgi:hypothetical protein